MGNKFLSNHIRMLRLHWACSGVQSWLLATAMLPCVNPVMLSKPLVALGLDQADHLIGESLERRVMLA